MSIPFQNENRMHSLKRLLMVAAMELEAEAIVPHLQSTEAITFHKHLGLTSLRASFGQHEIHLLQSGVGLVNAALTVSYAIDWFEPCAILLLGVAGALDPGLNIGDTVVASQILQHDAVYTGPAREFMAPGELHLSVPESDRPSPWLLTDAPLSQWTAEKISAMNLKVKSGTLLSGSEFVGRTDRKKELTAATPGALAVEMEAAGVAQIAKKRGIPIVVAKTIADRLEPSSTIAGDYLSFTKFAAQTASVVTQAILNEWKR